ncbi:nucleoside diphosphate kinase regulator [Pseudaeromonas sharmana]|uniref:Nucleoside diphosphate kinase regulator n=1 Tax=Pseudaeromonas sharmana TaxID=328412 RepID=A0ABV8CL38_9GAMM
MSIPPHIRMSATDLARIETLLETLTPQQCPGLETLEAELARAEILPLAQMPDNVVRMHSRVRFRLLPGDSEFCLTLVYPHEVQGQQERISILAPVGSALLGLTVGDRIDWPGPGGKPLRVELIDVSHAAL